MIAITIRGQLNGSLGVVVGGSLGLGVGVV